MHRPATKTKTKLAAILAPDVTYLLTYWLGRAVRSDDSIAKEALSSQYLRGRPEASSGLPG